MLAVGCLGASAQEASTKEVFNPHWYVQGQFGVQHTLGEVKFSGLNSPNAQVAIGYNFSKVWGARVTVGAWQSKGGITMHNTEYKYKWNYVAPTANVTFNVTNALFGFCPKRVVDFSIFAGVGANIPWGNDEAVAVDKTLKSKYNITADQVEFMHYLDVEEKTRPVGQFGAALDFKVCKRVALGLEANCNFLSDKYNCKKAGNADWYFNVLAGVKIALGSTTKTVPVEVVAPTIIEKIVRDTVVVKEQGSVRKEPIRRDIFFTIRGSEVSKSEMPKIEDIAEYLNRYPEAKVTVTGYADKGTGNPQINVEYARQRASKVASILTDKFGIKADRITVDSKGDTVQPYDINDLNRVSICVAE